MEQDTSYLRMDSLVKRIDLSPEEGYDDFRRCSEEFHSLPVRHMSKFTRRMMGSIDYDAVAKARRENYKVLLQALGGMSLPDGAVPMIFPYVAENGGELRKRLIQHKIFVAKYWPNVDDWADESAVETWMANNVLPLPIDHRYGEVDMQRIIKLVKNG
jgi:hypothetical protein